MISLAQTAIILAAAVVAVSLFRFLRLSSILGYLAAGLAIGPWGLNLIGEVGRILQVAQFGIVLLLFIIGLELQPTRLWVMRRLVFGLGAAQVLVCAVLLGSAAWALGATPTAAGIIGFGLSLSSTPLVLQVLAERRQLKTQQGRAAFGILLFQDLAVLPMLAVLPLMSPLEHAHAGTGAWWVPLLKLLAVIAVVIIGGGRLLLRPALRVVARARVVEVFTAAALLTVILTALLANLVGLSMALGAFLAGVLLADSEFRHELEADLEPFKGLLLGLFFIAVGMTANLGLLQVRAADPVRPHRRLPRCQGAGRDGPRRASRACARTRRGGSGSRCQRAGSSPSYCLRSRPASSILDGADRGPAGAGRDAVDDAGAAAAARARGARQTPAQRVCAALRRHRRA